MKHAEHTDRGLSLAKASEGALYRVTGIDPNACLCQLQSLGFAEGARLQLIRRVSGGHLLVCRIEEADVALRREIAASVRLAEDSDIPAELGEETLHVV